MQVALFYHAWAAGHWRQPLSEHRAALRAAQFDGSAYYGAVGAPADIAALNAEGITDLVASAPEGFENITINALHAYAQNHDGAILYAHTKGAADPSEFRARWRRSMTAHVIGRWRENLTLLEDHDAVGCHWLTAQQFPSITTPFFGGNFWMARCDYLRTLPPCGSTNRFDAERWIGLGEPRVVNLLAGWPDDNRWPELCTT